MIPQYWFNKTQQHTRGGATGQTGDQAKSKRASSGSPDLPVSTSPVACHAWPSAIATQEAHFAFSSFLVYKKSCGVDWGSS